VILFFPSSCAGLSGETRGHPELSSPRRRRTVRGNATISKFVVPAKAGTHAAVPRNASSRLTHVGGGMGPRFRGDDKENPSLYTGQKTSDPAKSTLCVERQCVSPDSHALLRGKPDRGLRASPAVGGFRAASPPSNLTRKRGKVLFGLLGRAATTPSPSRTARRSCG
jgi:hypothetical protein